MGNLKWAQLADSRQPYPSRQQLGLRVRRLDVGSCCYSVTQSCPTLCNPMDCSAPGLPVPHHLLEFAKFIFLALVMPSSRLILWCPLLLQSSIFPSIRDFSNESSVHIRWPKDWSFNFSLSPSSEYSGLISLKIDWFDLQGTFRSLLQHHSLKISVLWCSAFFTVQLSQPYVTTGKTIALTILTFVGRVMSLLFNTLSRFVIAFLPRSNHLLISWLHSPSAVTLEPKKRNSITTPPFPLLSAMQ